jgi:tetratricopeptide (TPR) repeat protein
MNRNEAFRHLSARNFSEAERHFNLALAERQRTAPETFHLLAGLSEALRQQGKVAEAEKTLNDASVLAESSNNRELKARALDATADFQLHRGDHAGAERTLIELEALEQQNKNPDHKRLSSAARKLGAALSKAGRAPEALKAFERSAQLAESAHGPEHPETASALMELGARYREAGQHTEAQQCLRRALKIHRAAAGADSLQATEDLFHLATSLAESGDVDGAAAEYERVLAMRERLIGADRAQTAETQARLAVIYLRGGRTSAARELLIHAIGVLDRGKGDPRLEFALETMAQVEDTLNHPAEAARWRQRAAESLAQRMPPPIESDTVLP